MLKNSVKAIISIIIFVYVFIQYGDNDALKHIYSSMNKYMLIALLFTFIQYPIVAFRWYILLHNNYRDIELFSIIKITYISNFFNQLFFSSLGGDLYRIMALKISGYSLKILFSSVFFERVLIIISLCLLSLIFICFELKIDDIINGELILLIPFIIIIIVYLLFLILLHVRNIILEKSRLRLINILNILSNYSYKVYKNRELFLSVFILSLIGSLNLSFIFYLISLSLKIPVSIYHVGIVVPLAILISHIPITIGGWGIREISVIIGFGYFGISSENAILLSISFGGLILISVLPAGVLFAINRKKIKKYKPINFPE